MENVFIFNEVNQNYVCFCFYKYSFYKYYFFFISLYTKIISEKCTKPISPLELKYVYPRKKKLVHSKAPVLCSDYILVIIQRIFIELCLIQDILPLNKPVTLSHFACSSTFIIQYACLPNSLFLCKEYDYISIYSSLN